MAKHESTALRALYALPILLWALPMARVLVFWLEPIKTYGASMVASGRFTMGEVDTPLITKFYGIKTLDDQYAFIASGLLQLTLWPADRRAWWGDMVLMIEYGGCYAALLFESCRGTYRKSPLQFAYLFALWGQFFAFGTQEPIILYILYVLSPISRFNVPISDREIKPRAALAAAIAGVLGYCPANWTLLFFPDFEWQQYGLFIWQLYPIWGAIIFWITYVLLGFVQGLPNTMTTVQAALIFAGVPSTIAYWYALTTSGFTWREIFIPDYILGEGPQHAAGVMPTLIQYEWLTCFGATSFWLLYSFGDLKAAGLSGVSWPVLFVLVFGGVALLGPGATYLLGWYLREQALTSDGLEKKLKSA